MYIEEDNESVVSTGNACSKRKWTAIEDEVLMQYVSTCGASNWSKIAECLPRRTSKQCRERWHNHLDPSIENIEWTKEDDEKLLKAHEEYGSHWSKISKLFEGRSDNSIRNRYNLMTRAANRKTRKENKVKRQKLEATAMDLNHYQSIQNSMTTENNSSFNSMLYDANGLLKDDLSTAKDLFTHFINEVHATTSKANKSYSDSSNKDSLSSESLDNSPAKNKHKHLFQTFPKSSWNEASTNNYFSSSQEQHLNISFTPIVNKTATIPVHTSTNLTNSTQDNDFSCINQTDLDFIYHGIKSLNF